MMKWIWPAPKREPMVVSQDGLGGAIDTISRSVAGGLLLPFLAYAIGNVCFKSVDNHLRRVILVSWNQYQSRWPVLLYIDTLEYGICLLHCVGTVTVSDSVCWIVNACTHTVLLLPSCLPAVVTFQQLMPCHSYTHMTFSWGQLSDQ